MVKRFLGCWSDSPGILALSVCDDATGVLSLPQGRTSPLLPALVGGAPAEVTASGVVAFLIARSPSQLLAKLVNDLDASIAQRTFITHGHACVVLFANDREEADAVVDALRPELRGHEFWPHEDGRVVRDDITVELPEVDPEWPEVAPVETTNLGFEAAAQIRQFNANLAYFCQVVSRYAAEVAPLAVWLQRSVADIASELAELAEDASDVNVRRIIGLESLLIEANATLTHYCSQIGSGQLPLGGSNFSVGEYSLLGIGAMARAAWRLYSHLSSVFGTFDLVGRLQQRYDSTPGFDWTAPSRASDYTPWRDLPAAFAKLQADPGDGPRLHIPFFSSRWGFHESMHSISLSWQCLHASATKEWNLLTLTHEFLHAHARDLLYQVLDLSCSDTALDELVTSYNERSVGSNALESLRLAAIRSLVNLDRSFRLSSAVTGARNETKRVPGESKTLTNDRVRGLMQSQSGLVQEIVVHTLDFLYVYDARDDDYINSIWSSWSLVPGVIARIDHYVLRTLCALAANSPLQNTDEQLFEDAVARLVAALEPLAGRSRTRPAIHEALALLNNEQARGRLSIQFSGARYTLELARCIFYDPSLNAALVRDDNTTVIDGTRTTYAMNTGDYPAAEIQSPIGFFLDRFNGYRDQAGDPEAEYESIWQMLQII